jgi:hypothetical protein
MLVKDVVDETDVRLADIPRRREAHPEHRNALGLKHIDLLPIGFGPLLGSKSVDGARLCAVALR